MYVEPGRRKSEIIVKTSLQTQAAQGLRVPDGQRQQGHRGGGHSSIARAQPIHIRARGAPSSPAHRQHSLQGVRRQIRLQQQAPHLKVAVPLRSGAWRNTDARSV